MPLHCDLSESRLIITALVINMPMSVEIRRIYSVYAKKDISVTGYLLYIRLIQDQPKFKIK